MANEQGSLFDRIASALTGNDRRERQLEQRGGIAEEMADCYGAPRYPDAPGYSNPTTSKDAAKSVEPRAAALRQRILAELQVRGSTGATCDELEQAPNGKRTAPRNGDWAFDCR